MFLSDIVTCPNKIFKLNLILNVICINILFYLSLIGHIIKLNVYHCSTAASQKLSDDTSYPFIDVYSSVVRESVIMKFAFMKCKQYGYFTVIKT